MLTKEMIICKFSGSRIIPEFINTSFEMYTKAAAQMIDIVSHSIGRKRVEIDEELNNALAFLPNTKIANGLKKTLEDRLEFSSPKAFNYIEERRKLFHISSKILKQVNYRSEHEYFEALEKEISLGNIKPEFVENDLIYADLPDNDKLLSINDVSVNEILNRYNIGLVQAILLSAENIEVELNRVTPQVLRRLLSVARFQRLVMDISCSVYRNPENLYFQNAENDNVMNLLLKIDGPASVLQHGKSYGIQLALFFPVICASNSWKMKASVLWTNRNGKCIKKQLCLDEMSGLQYYGRIGAYQPPEIKAFREYFIKNSTSWKIMEETPFLKGKNGTVIFPDFAFKNSDGNVVFLELFHNYHRRQLLNRLEEMERNIALPLAIGVDKGLANSEEISEKLAASAYFAKHGFLYRDFPAADKVSKALISFF